MRHITLFFTISCALLCASSCVVDKSERNSTDSELGYFSATFVNDVIIAPVKAVTQCIEKSQDIFKPGFETTMNSLYIKLLSAKDSTWAVSNALPTDQLTFSSTLKMLPDHTTGLHRWQCSGEGTYVENSSYMATLATVTPATFDWKEEKSTTSFSYNMCFTGSFTATTFLRSTGKGIDRCTISYSQTAVDNCYMGYNIKVDPVY